jgi:hypothetical protein
MNYYDTWKAGDLLFRGYYYERLQPGSRSYTLCGDSPHAYILHFSTLITKFQMPPTKHAVRENYTTYELTNSKNTRENTRRFGRKVPIGLVPH